MYNLFDDYVSLMNGDFINNQISVQSIRTNIYVYDRSKNIIGYFYVRNFFFELQNEGYIQ